MLGEKAMEVLLQLLPGEHIAAFPARFYYLGMLDRLKSCEYLRVPKSIYEVKAQYLLCAHQYKAISIHATENYQKIWNTHGFGNLIVTFLNRDEELLIKKNPSALHSTCVHGQISIKEDAWRWCHKCTVEDRDEFGISYYHRDHQIPGVFHCAKHKSLLSSNCRHCGFTVLSTFITPCPPISNVCPKCQSQIHPDTHYSDDVMEIIENKILEIVRNGSDYRLRDLTDHVRNFIGIETTTPITISEKKRLSGWKDFINSFLTSHARDTYFKKGKGKNGANQAEALLTKARIYNESSNSGIMHPLLHLIALKATEHEIFR